MTNVRLLFQLTYISGITNMIYAGIETVRAAAAKYMEEKLNEKQ